jgi:uncharacterized protein (DUF362 family)/ferredoxin
VPTPRPTLLRTERHGTLALYDAWHVQRVRAVVDDVVADWSARGLLPARRDARIVLKPNLNNDLPGLTGNATDLRVLDALLRSLAARGYTQLTVADGSNVGVHRRGIDVARRLRVDRLAAVHGARFVDLNRDEGRPMPLCDGAPRVAATFLDADVRISVPTLKTHAEAGLSCALKNLVGTCVGEDKRLMHRALAANIVALAEAVGPHLVLVDALVGMQGNGPGDGDPVRLDCILAGEDPFAVDLLAARITGLAPARTPVLVAAREAGRTPETLASSIEAAFPHMVRVTPPPPRRWLARMADHPALRPLKIAARPVTDRGPVARAARAAGVLQDVYDVRDDTLRLVARTDRDCATCRVCEAVCPTAVPLDAIGLGEGHAGCIGCLQCWWACPRDALGLEGDAGAIGPQAARWKSRISRSCAAER